MLGLVSLDSELPIALGTAQGVVKRVAPGGYPSRPDFEIVALKPGDEVVGVAQGPDTEELVFVTSDAQLLRFAASAVRPQGVAAGGMAGINLGAKARAIFFSVRRSGCGCRGRHDLDPDRDAGRRRSGAREGVAPRRVPRQGPRDRRRARAHVPQGRELRCRSPGRVRRRRWRSAATGRCAPCPTRERSATRRGRRWMPWSARSGARSRHLSSSVHGGDIAARST